MDEHLFFIRYVYTRTFVTQVANACVHQLIDQYLKQMCNGSTASIGALIPLMNGLCVHSLSQPSPDCPPLVVATPQSPKVAVFLILRRDDPSLETATRFSTHVPLLHVGFGTHTCSAAGCLLTCRSSKGACITPSRQCSLVVRVVTLAPSGGRRSSHRPATVPHGDSASYGSPSVS